MKLVAKQVKELRERKRRILELKDRCNNKILRYNDSLNEMISYINKILRDAEFTSKINTDFIDIGTKFRLFDNRNPLINEDLILVEDSTDFSQLEFLSIKSTMGKSVYGKKEGDNVCYKVYKGMVEVSLKIEEIDRIKSHYEHFIREKELNGARIDEEVGDYKITSSQYELLVQENNLRRSQENKINNIPIIESEDNGKVQVGSLVTVLLKNKEQEIINTFELINCATSTELESDYVEVDSMLGKAIYGKSEKEVFSFGENINGIILSIDNNIHKKSNISK